jgi:hypothetical protein
MKCITPDQVLILTSSEILGNGEVGPSTTLLNPIDWIGQRVTWNKDLGTIIGVTSTFTVAIRMDDGSSIVTRPGDFSFMAKEG